MCPCLCFYLHYCSCTISVRACVCTVDAVPGAQWPLPAFLSGGRSQLSAGWWSPCTCSARPPSADARPLDTLTTEHAYLLRRRRTGDIMCTHRCSSTHLKTTYLGAKSIELIHALFVTLFQVFQLFGLHSMHLPDALSSTLNIKPLISLTV